MFMFHWRICALGLGLLWMAGCGPSGPQGALPTYPSQAVVSYKGAPVEGAIVAFINETAPAYGRTDENGVAVMKTYREGDGAIAKLHNVTISKTNTTGEAPDVDQDSEEYDPKDAYGSLKVEHFVPQKYSSPATSKLTAEVKEVENNEFKFELVD